MSQFTACTLYTFAGQSAMHPVRSRVRQWLREGNGSCVAGVCCSPVIDKHILPRMRCRALSSSSCLHRKSHGGSAYLSHLRWEKGAQKMGFNPFSMAAVARIMVFVCLGRELISARFQILGTKKWVSLGWRSCNGTRALWLVQLD